MEEGVEIYARSRVMTAGKLQSILLLVEKASHLLGEILRNEKDAGAKLIQAQNIMAQLEICVDFRKGAAADLLFDFYEDIYRRMELGSESSLIAARSMLQHYRDTLEFAAKRPA